MGTNVRKENIKVGLGVCSMLLSSIRNNIDTTNDKSASLDLMLDVGHLIDIVINLETEIYNFLREEYYDELRSYEELTAGTQRSKG